MNQESTNTIKETEHLLIWHETEPAQHSEIRAFWKKLRHFYRTSELPFAQKKFTSALTPLLKDSNESNYPFNIDSKDGKHTSFELNPITPYYLLDHLILNHHQENKKVFKARLDILIIGLNKLLQIKDDPFEKNDIKETFNFADELIAFDKVMDMIPNDPKVELTKKRQQRLTEVIVTLQSGLKLYFERNGIVVVEKEIKSDIAGKSLFTTCLVNETKEDAFKEALDLFTKEVKLFVDLIRAYRIANLEINGEYKEDIHDEYFEHFTWYRLSEEELQLFHPVVLIVSRPYLFNTLTSFSKLLAANHPIKVVIINHELISASDAEITWEDASHQFRQEIAPIAMAHRNVYTFQSSMDEPQAVYDGLHHCLKSTNPSICHLLIPKKEEGLADDVNLIMKAENASRYFPRISYDPRNADSKLNKFDLSRNIQPTTKWPTYQLTVQTNQSAQKSMDVVFTYADYKAMFPQKAQELMIVPSAYYTEHLISLSEYLGLDEVNLYGKIPFIWVKDNDHHLHRAAVPNVWVVSCQERLDYWNYLQELSGLYSNQFTISTADGLSKSKSQSNSDIPNDNQTEQITATAQEEKAITKAVERLITALLDDEEFQLKEVKAQPSESQPKKEAIPMTKKVPEQSSATSDNSAPWLETENCTSCNECTEKYPQLFKYNSEKQAIINDVKKGTFEELVKAAEKCPAACIHPGMPLNPSEPNLAKLIKRAEKFN